MIPIHRHPMMKPIHRIPSMPMQHQNGKKSIPNCVANVVNAIMVNDAMPKANQNCLSIVRFVNVMVSFLFANLIFLLSDNIKMKIPLCFTVHPSCIGMSLRMVKRIREYAWQCNDCKYCIKCRKAENAEKLMNCDQCDRSYHIYCIGLRKIPNGE